MLRKVLEFGAVLEHVCQVWGLKVVVLEVIWGGLWTSFWVSLGKPLGGRSGCLSEVVVGVSGEPLGGRLGLCEGVHVERMLASLSLWVSLGSPLGSTWAL